MKGSDHTLTQRTIPAHAWQDLCKSEKKPQSQSGQKIYQSTSEPTSS
jgi:hypothetical protein